MLGWLRVRGKVVGFGGGVVERRRKGMREKYVKWGDSVIYDKEGEVYGVYEGKKGIGKEDCVFMVEG